VLQILGLFIFFTTTYQKSIVKRQKTALCIRYYYSYLLSLPIHRTGILKAVILDMKGYYFFSELFFTEFSLFTYILRVVLCFLHTLLFYIM
jgi:hypothetical protein